MKAKEIFKKFFVPIALCAIVTIPAIYTTFFLGSMWDPYGNIDQLPVAVVNLDKPVTYDSRTVDIGNQLVESLQEDASLDFHFTDYKNASSGLADGTYYMTIVIPEDFSANAITVLDEEPKTSVLQYETNPGTNYIASKMSETALAKINTKLSDRITAEYTQVIFDSVGKLHDGLSDAADGAGKLSDGMNTLSDGSQTIQDNLLTLKESTVTFSEGSQALLDGITAYTDGASALDDGAGTLADGAKELSSGANTLANGASTIESAAKQYTAGVDAVHVGAGTLNSNTPTLLNGADTVSSGASQLESGSKTLYSGLCQLSANISDKLPESSQITQISDGMTALSSGIQQLDQSAAALNSVSDMTSTVTGSLTTVGTHAAQAGQQLAALKSALTSFTASEAFQSLPAEQQQQLLADFSAPMAGLESDLTAIGSTVSDTASTLGGNSDDGSVTDKLTLLQSSIHQLNEKSQQLLPTASTAVTALYGGMSQTEDALNTLLIPGAYQLSTGSSTLSEGISSSLLNGIQAYTSGVSSLYDGTSQLTANSDALNKGVSELSNGAKELSTGANTLSTGADTLSAGAAQLCANNKDLIDGASKLNDGAGKISEGAGKLSDGSAAVTDGIAALIDGTATLKQGLSDGAEESAIASGKSIYDRIATPVEIQETKLTDGSNNGHAMAAYMMCVGLWVAAMGYCIVFSPKEKFPTQERSLFNYLRSLNRPIFTAIAAALVMVLALTLFNGFEPVYFAKLLGMASLTSVAFMMLFYFVNAFTGIIGSYAMLIFMVLQLSGSAGTYPIELSDGFFQSIHYMMPFTYAVNGFRSTIAAGTDLRGPIIFLSCMAILGFIGSSVAFLRYAKDVPDEQKPTFRKYFKHLAERFS